MEFQKLDKKSLLYLGIIILLTLISIFLIWHFSKIPEIKETHFLPVKQIQEEILKKQQEERIKEQLESLNQGPVLSEKEIKKQLQQSNKGRSLSEGEVKKQLEELSR